VRNSLPIAGVQGLELAKCGPESQRSFHKLGSVVLPRGGLLRGDTELLPAKRRICFTSVRHAGTDR
jgi:hypothetical protein